MGTLTLPSSPAPSKPLLSLQVLRAVAAGLVLVHHAGFDADTIAGRIGAAPLALDRWFDGAFGIHLFFVISGFIMLRSARGFGSARGAAAFMLRRALRVVPLYWMLTALVMVGAAAVPEALNAPLGGPAVILGSLSFIPVLRQDGELRPVLGQGWTLDYEMFFYVLFALAMPLPRRAALAALATALVALVALGYAMRPTLGAASTWTDGLLLEFLFGLGLGLLQERGWRLGRIAAATAVAGGVLAAVTSWQIPPAAALAPWLREGLPATLIVGGCVLGPPWPATRSLLGLALLGDASYSLYLSHPFAVRLLRSVWLAGVPVSVPVMAYLPAAVALAVATALALYRWVERPMTSWLQRRSGLIAHDRSPVLVDAAARIPARRG